MNRSVSTENGADVRARMADECAKADRSTGQCPDPISSSWKPEGATDEKELPELSWLTGERRAS